jgi:hypothetical protein
MNQTVVALAFFMVAVPVGCALLAFVGALVFPSTREAIVAAIHRKFRTDTADMLDASVSAQIMALRNELYALRCEVAASRADFLAGDASAGRIGRG